MNVSKCFRPVLFLLAAAGLLAVLPGTRADEAKSEPPKGAIVLFDGKDLSGWSTLGGKPAEWPVMDGYMEVGVRKGDIRTRDTFGPDFKLHVEFWLPLMPKARDQARANSGVYLQGRYEVQVLDSYHNETYQDGSVGALYKLIAPDKKAQEKAVRPPEQWNTYDITFHAPRVDNKGKVTRKGRITVNLNGIDLIKDGEFDQVTGGAMDNKIGTPGPIRLQDHGCKVRYRNIWLKPLSEASTKE
jgi:hypothetical protein